MPESSEKLLGTLSRESLCRFVQEQGLELLGVVPLAEEARYQDFQKWLAAGKNAGMDYLERNLHCRQDPRKLHPGSQSAIILALPYYQGDKFRKGQGLGPVRVAQYARLRDYHKVLRKKGEKVLAWVLEEAGEEGSGRVVVDSAPMLERALAAQTVEGFIGKNTLYIHPQKGSYFLLAEILTTLALSSDRPAAVDPSTRSAQGGCGSCRRCQVNCPTGALKDDYTLDASLCLSYYTIEHRGPIPVKFWPWLKYYLFGCDICQLVCPYNRQVKPVKLDINKIDELPPLAEIAMMDQQKYEEVFGGTPMTRAKKDGLRRNALIAMVVNNDPQLPAVLELIEKEQNKLLDQTVAQIAEYAAMHANK